MINQKGIHQLLVMSLSSMNKIISWSGKLNERRNEFLSHYELTKKGLTIIPYSRVNPEL